MHRTPRRASLNATKKMVADSDSSGTDMPLNHKPKSASKPVSKPKSNGNATTSRKRPIADDSDLSEDDDAAPLAKRLKAGANGSSATTAGPNGVNGKSNAFNRESTPLSSDDDDDAPLANGNGHNHHDHVETVQHPPAVIGMPPPKREQEESSSDDDGAPLIKKSSSAVAKKPARKSNGKSKPASTTRRAPVTKVKKEESEDDDDEKPLAASTSSRPTRTRAPPKKKVKKEESVDDDEASSSPPSSGSDVPISRSRKRKTAVKKQESSDDEDGKEEEGPSSFPRAPVKGKGRASATSTSKVKAKSSVTPAPRGKVKKEEDDTASPKKEKKKTKRELEMEAELAEVHRWWEQEQIQGDGTAKWATLEHNGVLFPPPYVPLPKSVKMKYDGKPIVLSEAAEEVAGFFAALLEAEHAADPVFQKNFFNDWLEVLKDNPSTDSSKIKVFEKCDFRPMYLYFEEDKAKKKTMTKAEKQASKEEKEMLEAPYKECVLDGRTEKVGNFRIEPPGLFKGRGQHPKKGCLKNRVRPEDIVINIGKDAKIPKPNMPGKWNSVVHDNQVTWLANWKENINGNFKYVFLAAGSSLKGQSDMQKFEKARELKDHVARIRKDYVAELKSKVTADRQRATAMYFIDKLALRAGNEKGEDEADTVGCCSLRYEHITLNPPNELIFDFLGKDSIRYFKTVEVDLQVFKNIRLFKMDNKQEGDALFDRVNTSTLNKHLQSYMKGLTAKVFRTYNASITFQQQLDMGTPADGTDAEKLAAYNEANRMVAILCNHQKSVSKGHGTSMEKLSDKLRGLKYQRMKLRHILFKVDPKIKSKRKDLAEMESDLDDDFVVYWEDDMKKKEIEKAEKKFAKANEALVEEGKEPENDKVLKKTIKGIEAQYEALEAERDGKDVDVGRYKDSDQVIAQIEKMDERIATFKVNMDTREKGKDVALGTSKINYLDPRITVAWCKQYEIPVTKLFSKTLLTKFPWAMEVDAEWKF
ncbi:DNA topoisomerase 1 [Tulasnella sp. JGI-2019a]|nr:DNA topoisomerase 1 [Tulasnella sp. JGI-2019a]